MAYYIKQPHPLDVAAQEEAEAQERQRKKSAKKTQAALDWQHVRPLVELSLQVLQYEVALHIGHDYIYAGNKVRHEKEWPTTHAECVEFLQEKGLKR